MTWSSAFVRTAAAARTSAPTTASDDCRPSALLGIPLVRACASSVRIEVCCPTDALSCSALRYALAPTMASADCCHPSRRFPTSVALRQVTSSPRVLHAYLHAYVRRIYNAVPYEYRALHLTACSPRRIASIRFVYLGTSALPSASFRSPVARGTLAVQLTLPLVGCAKDFHLQVSAPCRAHGRPAGGQIGFADLSNRLFVCRGFESR